jgi:hypothetical protein
MVWIFTVFGTAQFHVYITDLGKTACSNCRLGINSLWRVCVGHKPQAHTMMDSPTSTSSEIKPSSALLAAFRATIANKTEYQSLTPSDIQAFKVLIAKEQQGLQPLFSARVKFVRRILKLLGMNRFYHEINTFIETAPDVLLSYLYHQGEMFLARHAAAPLNNNFSQITAAIDMLQQRLQVKSNKLHQQPCYPNTAVRRALLIMEYMAPASKVLCLGDDDFISIALSMLAGNEIAVLDLDPQVIELIKETASKQQFKVETHIVDIRQPLPKQLIEAFDVVVTDPIYFVNDMIPFLTAAELCLRKAGSSALLSCCSRALAGSSWQMVEAWAVSRGLAADKFFEGFNEYPKPARTRDLLLLAERFLCRTRLTRACAGITQAYSDIVVFRYQN